MAQVEIQPGIDCGLGWMTSNYKGKRLLSHSGVSEGFTSELTFKEGCRARFATDDVKPDT